MPLPKRLGYKLYQPLCVQSRALKRAWIIL